ncbi:MAG: hypothetical protein IPJ45_15180 [Ignavibacteria bacterium]|nr:hypothetical protein [Ignavibacteria bacterium]
MDAIRQKIKRTGNKLIIDLPEEFKSEMFELILFPIENDTSESDNQLNEWSDFSLRNLETFYNKDEPDYTNVKIKEPNEKYKP